MAVLMLENGTVFEGEWFGAKHTCIGEVVFNTGMTGYQELLLDPAYCDQIVAMTYPLIGNDGIEVTVEFAKPALKAFIIRELCELPSSWVKIGKLEDFFEKNNICGLQGIDTRALTRIIRENPGMRGIITDKYPTEEQISEMRAFKSEGTVKKVTSKEKHEIDGDGAHVAVMDLGINQGVLKMLVKRNCRVTVFPATATAAEIIQSLP
jgi:carbamoyl-phosphate synthase small subunit